MIDNGRLTIDDGLTARTPPEAVHRPPYLLHFCVSFYHYLLRTFFHFNLLLDNNTGRKILLLQRVGTSTMLCLLYR